MNVKIVLIVCLLHVVTVSGEKLTAESFLKFLHEAREIPTNINAKSIKSQLGENRCRPRKVLVSTYTDDRGSQTPRTAYVTRCQGGVMDPTNYQCLPTLREIKCLHTKNDLGKDDFIGAYHHLECEEKCICNRKSCKGKKIHKLQCPKGFKEDPSTCLCKHSGAGPIFYRNEGVQWDNGDGTMALNEQCRQWRKK